jgi:hypothetical protein
MFRKIPGVRQGKKRSLTNDFQHDSIIEMRPDFQFEQSLTV